MINSQRLVNTFLELVAIDSPSGQEAAISAHLADRLTGLGGDVLSDEYGNLVATGPASATKPIG